MGHALSNKVDPSHSMVVLKSLMAPPYCPQLSCEFEDADRWHSADSVRKMSEGIPLTDEVRIYDDSVVLLTHSSDLYT